MSNRPCVWVTELASRFWELAGDPPPFPRDLRDVVPWLHAVHFLEVPTLTTATAAEHLRRLNIRCPFEEPARPLAGCFAGERGSAAVLIDADLEPVEARFTVAHEVAHFLRDYDAPRRKVLARLGPHALAVLDGERLPTPDEHLASILREVELGPATHFMDRDHWGRTLTAQAQRAEEAADRLAFELLAPFDMLEPDAAVGHAAIVNQLTSHFGLPLAQANAYTVGLIGRMPPRTRSFRA